MPHMNERVQMPPLRGDNRAQAINDSRPFRRGHTGKISIFAASEIVDWKYGGSTSHRYR